VSEGKDCQEATGEGKLGQASKPVANSGDAAPGKRGKTKSAGNRRIPSFLRSVDLLFQGR